MKFTTASTSLAAVVLSGLASTARGGSADTWEAPGPDDFRGPCPMMNTLANHGFLPHDGKNLTEDVVVKALGDGINFGTDLAKLMFQMAIIANPEPNATFFTLDNLNRHNVLEHDASLSRTDAYLGNNHVFNESVFEESSAYWTDELMTATMLADSKLARMVASRAVNPTYTFTSTMEQFSLGELIAPIIAFGNMNASTTNRTLVKYWFENERLPSELGWTKTATTVTLTEVSALTAIMANATSLFTTTVPVVTDKKKRSMARIGHFGAY